MRHKPFHFELKDIIYQFIAAFDDVIIQKYNNERESVGQIKVQFILSSKGRVLHYIINKQKDLNLPVISIGVSGFKYNTERERNKQQAFYGARGGQTEGFFKHAVPIDITIRMSIMAKYQQDLEQIIQNFQVSTNPYLILLWKLPKTLGFTEEYKVEIPVSWSGDVSITYPEELQENQKQIITADTSFTIQAWMFREGVQNPQGRIYEINQDFQIPSDLSIITDKTTIEEIDALINPDETERITLLSSDAP